MKQKLIEWANKYEVASFIANDPVQFPRKHIGKRAEISGFITSWLSFGNRKAIIKAADWLDKDFCDDPYCWLMTKQYNREMDKLLAEKLNDRNLAPSIVPPLIQHLHTGMVSFAGVEGKFDYREQNVVTAMKVIKNRIDSIEFSVF